MAQPFTRRLEEPIDENSACVEVGTISQTPRERGVHSETICKNYFSSNDITCEEVKSIGINVFIGYIDACEQQGSQKKKKPWQWKRRKKRNRFNRRPETLQRKISMRSTKDQLVEKMFLCRFSSGLHGNAAADSVRSELAVVACSQSRRSLQPRRRTGMKLKPETVELVEENKNFWIREKERERKNAR
ncbi:hypothetical protein TNCV_4182061, partial [Trichonephila clavipes]